MANYSPGLKLVWDLARLEAAALGSSRIEPVHWFLGLAKVVDLDLSAVLANVPPDELVAMSAEVDAVRRVFQSASVDFVRVRRSLRSQLGGARRLSEPD